MNILLDTCVVSELRRPKGKHEVREAVQAIPHDALFLSVITIGEITKGAQLLDEGRKKREILAWLAEIDREFEDRVLGIDRETARVWGEITARAQGNGIQIPVSDGLIAAVALRHGLHLMTRNSRHFTATGVLIIDPWQSARD